MVAWLPPVVVAVLEGCGCTVVAASTASDCPRTVAEVSVTVPCVVCRSSGTLGRGAPLELPLEDPGMVLFFYSLSTGPHSALLINGGTG
jgi:hypothetical protein